MKAAVFRGPLSIEVEERPVPSVGSDEALVRVGAVGICGSDVHGFLGKSGKRRLPGLIMGHEASGEVMEVGAAVSCVKKGDRVAIDPQLACGTCETCRRGFMNLCDNMVVIGSSMRTFRDGAMCQFIAIGQHQLHRLAPQVSYSEGAMIDPIGNAVHVLDRAEARIGDTIAILGVGTIGLILVQLARRSNVGKVIVVDVSESRLALAKQFAADVAVKGHGEDPVEVIMKETRGRGADIVVESAGPSATYSAAIKAVKKRGKVVALGFSQDSVEIPVQPLLFREITMIGCTGFVSECDTALDLLACKKIDVKPLIKEYPLDEVQSAFMKVSEPGTDLVKAMIIPC